MNNNKGTVLLLVIIFVIIFSILGLLAMRLAVMHNADINKDLISARIYYAAESALERAAFRMALLTNPIKVPAGTPNAAIINAVKPSLPSTVNNQQVWYYDNAATPPVYSQAAIIHQVVNGIHRWLPLTGEEWLDDKSSPKISVAVFVTTETANPIDGGIIVAKPAPGNPNSVVIEGKPIDFGDGSDARPKSPFYLNSSTSTPVPFRLDVVSIVFTNQTITFNMNANNTGRIPVPSVSSATLPAANRVDVGNSNLQSTYQIEHINQSGLKARETNHVKMKPAIFKIYYNELIKLMESEKDKPSPVSAEHYVIKASALAEGSNLPAVNLEFHYSIGKFVSEETFEDLMNGVGNSNITGNPGPVVIPFTGMNRINVSNGQLTISNSTDTYKAYFRGRK